MINALKGPQNQHKEIYQHGHYKGSCLDGMATSFDRLAMTIIYVEFAGDLFITSLIAL